MTRRSIRLAVAAVAVAGLTGTVALPAMASDGYDATVAGQSNFRPLVNLATSSVQSVDVVNLPANVGLYVLHCKVPADPRQPPTLCDASDRALAYLPAVGVATPAVSIPIKVNGEFFGTDPNPTAAPTAGASVDCRADTGNPRATACAVYVLGAGRDSANPAYLRVFPTAFLPVSAQRRNDSAIVTLDGSTVRRGTTPRLSADAKVPFSVTLASGLTPSVSADNCSIANGEITALTSTGTCIVRITSTGGRTYKPLVKTQVFRLRK